MVINCTFSANMAGNDGGAMNANTNLGLSEPVVINCTFMNNTAGGFAGGIRTNQAGVTATVVNSILWGNTVPQIVDEAGAVTTVTYSDVQGGFAGTGNIDADPLFADAEGRLGPGSPAIDVGDNTLPQLASITTDLGGNPRFADDPATADGGNGTAPIIDMGAFEYATQCPWDCDGSDDGVVGINDFLDLLAHWGPCP